MQSIFFQVCVFLGGQLKVSQSNWQLFLGKKKTKQDDIKGSFSYEESRPLSNTHFFDKCIKLKCKHYS